MVNVIYCNLPCYKATYLSAGDHLDVPPVNIPIRPPSRNIPQKTWFVNGFPCGL